MQKFRIIKLFSSEYPRGHHRASPPKRKVAAWRSARLTQLSTSAIILNNDEDKTIQHPLDDRVKASESSAIPVGL